MKSEISDKKLTYIVNLFNRLSKAEITPSTNYNMLEEWMYWALRGREKSKKILFETLSLHLGVDTEVLEIIFTKMFGNKINESKDQKSKKKILRESKVENWGPDDFVTWEEIQYCSNHGAEFTERNRERADMLGIPEDERCAFCEKPLKRGKYKIVYAADVNDPDYREAPYGYFANPHPHMKPFKVGSECVKALESAHKLKYENNIEENKTNRNMNKKLIRLTEGDLHRIVKESVKRILYEDSVGNHPEGYPFKSKYGTYEFGKTIKHIPTPNTPLPYRPDDSMKTIGREFREFCNKNDYGEILTDYFYNDNISDFKKIGQEFADEMNYDFEYIYPALKMSCNSDYYFNSERL